MTLTPGSYLRLCRQAMGLSVDDLALALETDPIVSARVRAEWLTAMETDVAPIAVGTGIALYRVMLFDPKVLDALMMIHAGDDAPEPRLCRTCGCSEDNPCINDFVAPCAWAAENLCTGCVDTDHDARVAAL